MPAPFVLKMIDERLRNEIRKVMEQKASSAFLASVLPVPAADDAQGEFLHINAVLKWNIEVLDVDYTAHAGGDAPQTLQWTPEEREIRVHTSLRLKRPGAVQESSELKLEAEEILLAASCSGIEFKQTMMGVGATVHGVRFRFRISGSGTGKWQTNA